MHARHRSPGNGGYRSASMGMGVAPARISPETSATTTRGNNHGFYNPEYHRNNFKHGGFGRGKTYSKPNHSPIPRKGSSDIFMEAGKLVAQYLGMLAPPTGKWQGSNNNNNKKSGEFQDGEDARPSALARLGTSDTVVLRRRYSDDYNSMGPGLSKFNLKGRKRENFQSERSDWGRENGEPWLDGTRSAPHAEEDNDSIAFERSEDRSNGLQKSESALKGEEAGDSESEMVEKHDLQNEMEHSKKLGSSNAGEELQRDSGVEHSKKSDDAATDSNGERVELGDGNISLDNEKKGSSTTEDLSTEHCSKNPDDLLAVCKFGNVLTKKRSSLKPEL